MAIRQKKLSAYEAEVEKLEALQKEKELESIFLTTEGEGIAKTADVEFGFEEDEELTEEEKRKRATGITAGGLDLIL